MRVTIIKRVTLAILIFFFVAIIGSWFFDQSQPDFASALKELTFSFEFDAPLPEVLEEPFRVQTDNCGSPVSTVESFKRKRDFAVQANWKITEALLKAMSQQFGSELNAIELAELKASFEQALTEQLETSNGIDIGYVETFEAERQITTPANSKSTTWLQWEELRYVGIVEIFDPFGDLLNETSFYVVRDLRLSQIRVLVEPCETGASPEPTTPALGGTGGKTTTPPIRLVEPLYEIYQNPLSFSWDGSDETLYQVTLIHRDHGYKHTSDWIQGFIWVYQLPGEQYGNWDWYVSTKDGVTSDVWSFIFDPFP